MTQCSWKLAGDVLENCTCDVVCPGHFSFRNRCTHDTCDAVWAFVMANGRFGETDLAGLSAAVVARAQPFMVDGDWKMALYVDDKASEDQAEALDAIFGGRAGGPWAVLDRFVGRRFPTRRVPIRFERHDSGRLRSVEIPGILKSEVAPIRGHDKQGEALLVNLFNTLYQPEHVIARGKLEYHDHGFDWTPPDQPSHGILTTFDWTVDGSDAG